MCVSGPAATAGCQTNCLVTTGQVECHNYGFTTEIHTTFVHTSTSEGFAFVSDDDLWVSPCSVRLLHTLGHTYNLLPPAWGKQAMLTPTFLPLQAFVNNYLVVDVGSLHKQKQVAIVFTAENAAAFGMRLGEVYNLDVFQAERHSIGAHPNS